MLVYNRPAGERVLGIEISPLQDETTQDQLTTQLIISSIIYTITQAAQSENNIHRSAEMSSNIDSSIVEGTTLAIAHFLARLQIYRDRKLVAQYSMRGELYDASSCVCIGSYMRFLI